MYLILNSNSLICEIAQHPCYVRRQANGVVITCDKEHADAIYSNDTDSFYPVERVGYLWEKYHIGEVEEVPEHVTAGYYYHAGEFYTNGEPLDALARANVPGFGSYILGETAKIENALCDMDIAAEERIAEIENALCDMDTGGNENG